MKRLLFATTLSLFAFFGTAQIEGGTIMAGGSLRFNHYTAANNGGSSTSFVINPQIGIAFADNFVAGSWLEFTSFSNLSSWRVGPFVRYYMKNFFFQVGYGYTRTGDVGVSLLDLELGYAMFFNDNVALEPAVYYNQYFNGGGYDLGAKIGFQIYFNR